MSIIKLTEPQADFLNQLGSASKNYRDACNSVAARANEELTRMTDGFGPFGPNHQTMQEMGQYYGEVRALLSVVWHIFPVGTMFTDDMLQDARNEVLAMIKEAMAEAKYGISGFKFWMADQCKCHKQSGLCSHCATEAVKNS